MTEVIISEEFNNSQGKFSNYDAYTAAQRTAVRNLQHVNIRNFALASFTAPYNVLALSADTMTTLNGFTMTQLTGSRVVHPGEAWDTGSTGEQNIFNHQLGLLLGLVIGTVTTTSSLPNDVIDIQTGFDDDDFISMACPNYRGDVITATTSFLDLTSNPDGTFTDASHVASLKFSDNLNALPGGAADTELRWRRSAIHASQPGVDLSKITGVRIRVTSTATVVASGFRCKGIRLLSKNWTQPAVDIDTRHGLLRMPYALNGGSVTPAFTMPIMWRADETNRANDPRPIDSEIGITFNAGSQAFPNSFTLYFREVTEDFLTQLDIDGKPMSWFDGHTQPDLGAAMFNSRTQTDIEAFHQSQLDTQKQFDLERIPDGIAASWIQMVFQWGAIAGNTLSVLNTEGGGYTFNVPALAGGDYTLIISLIENGARARLYPLDESGNLQTAIFDSALADDDFAYKRRAGRFGWAATFGDGNATINSIRTRYLNFAEYRSLPLESVTPVVGAELFTAASPDKELFTGFSKGQYNNASTKVSKDTARSLSGESFKIVNSTAAAVQGVESNIFRVSNWNEINIKYDLYVPSGVLTSIEAFLLGEVGRIIQLDTPSLVFDQWQSVNLSFPLGDTTQAGSYQLALYQIDANPVTWWIDNVSVNEPTVSWSGRASTDDPWQSNRPAWTPFKKIQNLGHGGILFDQPGNQLQVRGVALHQDASIDDIQFRPKYKELGRFAWTSDALTGLVGPTSNFTSAGTPDGVPHKLRFTSLAAAGNSSIALYEWNFGDGTKDTGYSVDHLYAAGGTYPVTLTVTDGHGVRHALTQNAGA